METSIMTAKSDKDPSSSRAAETQPSPAQPKPKLILPLGRGHNGKSFWARWMIDRAQTRGREIVVADGDRTNPALGAFFHEVLTPPSAEPDDMEVWFMALCAEQSEKRFNAVLDLGGGDQLLKAFGRKLDFSTYFEELGIEPVAVYLLSSDPDDLAFLRDLEADGLFAPEATILVLNEGRADGRKSSSGAFNAILEHRIFTAAMKRGAVPIVMPRLFYAAESAVLRLTPSAAVACRSREGHPPLGVAQRQFIAKWLRDMEQNFAPVASWLA